MKERKEGILGVLGGMGPQATNTFYQADHRPHPGGKGPGAPPGAHLERRQDPRPHRRHPGRAGGGGAGLPGPPGRGPAAERAGCTVLAIPCNTSHYFADRLQAQLKIPLIHMIRETVAAIQAMGKKTVGILATDGTVPHGDLPKGTHRRRPHPGDPAGGTAGGGDVHHLRRDQARGDRLPGEVRRGGRLLRQAGCDCAILGCTELSVYRNLHSLPPYYIDAMEVLAQQAILRCGKQLRNV